MISSVLLQQSLREASVSGHLHIVKALLEQYIFDEAKSRYICFAMCEARMNGRQGTLAELADLRALAPTRDKTRLLEDELIIMMST